jgi:hypothetical protein
MSPGVHNLVFTLTSYYILDFQELYEHRTEVKLCEYTENVVWPRI